VDLVRIELERGHRRMAGFDAFCQSLAEGFNGVTQMTVRTPFQPPRTTDCWRFTESTICLWESPSIVFGPIAIGPACIGLFWKREVNCGVRQRFGKVRLAFKNRRPLDRKILVLREYRPCPNIPEPTFNARNHQILIIWSEIPTVVATSR
jgi:hypothetical protein